MRSRFLIAALWVSSVLLCPFAVSDESSHPFTDDFGATVADKAFQDPKFAVELLHMERFANEMEFSPNRSYFIAPGTQTPNDVNYQYAKPGESVQQWGYNLDEHVRNDIQGTDPWGSFTRNAIGQAAGFLGNAKNVGRGYGAVIGFAGGFLGDVVVKDLEESAANAAQRRIDDWAYAGAEDSQKTKQLYYNVALKLKDAMANNPEVEKVLGPRIYADTHVRPSMTPAELQTARQGKFGRTPGTNLNDAAKRLNELKSNPEAARSLTPEQKREIKALVDAASAEFTQLTRKDLDAALAADRDARLREKKLADIGALNDQMNSRIESGMVGIISDLAGFVDPKLGAAVQVGLGGMLEVSKAMAMANEYSAMAEGFAKVGNQAAEQAASALAENAAMAGVTMGASMVISFAKILTAGESGEMSMLKHISQQITDLKHQLEHETDSVKRHLTVVETRLMHTNKLLAKGLEAILGNQAKIHETLLEVSRYQQAQRKMNEDYYMSLLGRMTDKEREDHAKEEDQKFVECFMLLKQGIKLNKSQLRRCINHYFQRATNGASELWAAGPSGATVEEMQQWGTSEDPLKWAWAESQSRSIFKKAGVTPNRTPFDYRVMQAPLNPYAWAEETDQLLRAALKNPSVYYRDVDPTGLYLDQLLKAGDDINSGIELLTREGKKPRYKPFLEALKAHWESVDRNNQDALSAQKISQLASSHGWDIYGAKLDFPPQHPDLKPQSKISMTYCENSFGENGGNHGYVDPKQFAAFPHLYQYEYGFFDELVKKLPPELLAAKDRGLGRFEICISRILIGKMAEDGKGMRLSAEIAVKFIAKDGTVLEKGFAVTAPTGITLEQFGVKARFPHRTISPDKAIREGLITWDEQGQWDLFNGAKILEVNHQRLRLDVQGSSFGNEVFRQKANEVAAALRQSIEFTPFEWTADSVRAPLAEAIKKEREASFQSGAHSLGSSLGNSGRLSLEENTASLNYLRGLVRVAFPDSIRTQDEVIRYLEGAHGIPSGAFSYPYLKQSAELGEYYTLEPLNPFACAEEKNLAPKRAAAKKRFTDALNLRLRNDGKGILNFIKVLFDGKTPLFAGSQKADVNALVPETPMVFKRLLEFKVKQPTNNHEAVLNRNFLRDAAAWRMIQAVICVGNLLDRKDPNEKHPIVEAERAKIELFRMALPLLIHWEESKKGQHPLSSGRPITH